MAVPSPKLTPDEYLTRERAAEFKSEYWQGEIFAMAGVSLPHDVIQGNVKFQARLHLSPGKCSAHGSDREVGVHRGRHGFAYPDAFILCGPPQFYDSHRDVVTNPVVILEVLSPTTEAYDRGRKFAEYRKLASLRHYVLISPDRMLVEHFAKQSSDRWLLEDIDPGGTLRFPDLPLEIPIALLYERVEFPPANPADGPGESA